MLLLATFPDITLDASIDDALIELVTRDYDCGTRFGERLERETNDSGAAHAAALNAPRQGSGFACFARIGESPDAQVVAFNCDIQEQPTTNPGLESFYARIEYGPVDLRSLAVGDSTVPVRIMIDGSDSSCETSTSGSIAIVDAKGTAAPDPKFVSDDYVRRGNISLDPDTTSVEGWTAEAPGASKNCLRRPSVIAHMTASFEQLPQDFDVDEQPSCLISSK